MNEQLDMFESSVKQISQMSFGTQPKEMVRHTDPTTSIEAACEVNSPRLEELVYGVIKSFGRAGCIGDDVHAALPHIGIQTISPRYKGLKKKKMIVETGEKRIAKSGKRQMVLRAV